MAAGDPPAAPDQEPVHIVKAGETLGGVAARAKVPRILIAEANGLKPPFALRAGQRLMIPRTRHHTVRRGETGFDIAMDYGVSWPAIAVANGMHAADKVHAGQELLIPTVIAPRAAPASAPALSPSATATQAGSSRFIWPASGPVRRGFAARTQRRFHDGIDITAEQGSAVRASAAGRVVFARDAAREYGNLVVIDHGGGWHSAYAFLSRITVKRGDRVGQGERIGLAGSTGRAVGSELHFELRRRNRPVDPLAQLPEAPKP